MKASDLDAASRATLEWLRGNPPDATNPLAHPYYGFYDVEIFECPPFVMFTAHDCPRAINILYGRCFEPLSTKLWCRLAPEATGILDIGAHVGVYSLIAAAKRPDLKIHAFEPNPYAFARLRMHKLINGFKNIAEHTFAVGDQSKVVPFSWVRKDHLVQIASGGAVGDRKRSDTENIIALMGKLDGTGLASTLGDKALIKIDVEGGEVAVFAGMQEILALKPDIILETFDGAACDAINAMILPLGYRVFHILEQRGEFAPREKVEPSDVREGDYNQLLTLRDAESLHALIR